MGLATGERQFLRALSRAALWHAYSNLEQHSTRWLCCEPAALRWQRYCANDDLTAERTAHVSKRQRDARCDPVRPRSDSCAHIPGARVRNGGFWQRPPADRVGW